MSTTKITGTDFNKIGKVNDKKKYNKKSNNKIGKFWNRKKSAYRRTGPKSTVEISEKIVAFSEQINFNVAV